MTDGIDTSSWAEQWERMNNDCRQDVIKHIRATVRGIFTGIDLTDEECDAFGKEFITITVKPWHFDKPIDFK